MRVFAMIAKFMSCDANCWIDPRALSMAFIDRPITSRISSLNLFERRDRLRTSSATTANPRPASPARAASIAAFNTSRLV